MTSHLDRFREKFPVDAFVFPGTVKRLEKFFTTALAEEYARGQEDAVEFIGSREGWEESKEFYRKALESARTQGTEGETKV